MYTHVLQEKTLTGPGTTGIKKQSLIQIFSSFSSSLVTSSGDSGETSMTLQESMPVLPMSESEELMPCIPEGLSSDLLMDMETVLSGSHMDRDSLLTWL